jgi:Ca2+-binding EF-hand superfamily protein
MSKKPNSRPTTARELTAKQREEFKEAFDLFDLNKDNKISKDELGKVMQTLGMNPTKQELKGHIHIQSRHSSFVLP